MMMAPRREIRELTVHESLCLLGSVPLGRIAFTANAMPEIRPVIHILENDVIIIRSRVGAAIQATDGQIVSYEADTLDAETRLGWSVIVLGRAQVVRNAAEVERYNLAMPAWVNLPVDYVIRIHPETVTGYELIDGTAT